MYTSIDLGALAMYTTAWARITFIIEHGDMYRGREGRQNGGRGHRERERRGAGRGEKE